MLKWARIFAIISIVAAVFGFGGVSEAAGGIAKAIFFVFLALCVVFAVPRFAVFGRVTRRSRAKLGGRRRGLELKFLLRVSGVGPYPRLQGQLSKLRHYGCWRRSQRARLAEIERADSASRSAAAPLRALEESLHANIHASLGSA